MISRSAAQRIAGLLSTAESVAVTVQAVRTMLMVGYLVLSTRLLGPVGYGQLAAAIGIAALFGQFVGLGAGIAKVRDAARNPAAFPSAWGLALCRYAVTGTALTLVFTGTTTYVLRTQVGPLSLALIGLSELLLFPLTLATAYAFLATGHIRTASAAQLLTPAFKVLTLCGWILSGDSLSVNGYAWLMVASSGAGLMLSLLLASRRLPLIRWPRVRDVLHVRKEILYSINGMTNQAITELDKPLTLHLASAADAGLYGVAARIVGTAAGPITAVIQTQAPRLFGYGPGLSASHLQFLRFYGAMSLIYGAVTGTLLWILSPYLHLVLGASFAESSTPLKWMCMWLPLFALRQIAGATLTSSDHVTLRIVADVIGALAFLVLAQHLIPARGPEGTALCLLAAEGIWIVVGCLFLSHVWLTGHKK